MTGRQDASSKESQTKDKGRNCGMKQDALVSLAAWGPSMGHIRAQETPRRRRGALHGTGQAEFCPAAGAAHFWFLRFLHHVCRRRTSGVK